MQGAAVVQIFRFPQSVLRVGAKGHQRDMLSIEWGGRSQIQEVEEEQVGGGRGGGREEAYERVGVEAERLLLFLLALIVAALHVFILPPKKHWVVEVRFFFLEGNRNNPACRLF